LKVQTQHPKKALPQTPARSKYLPFGRPNYGREEISAVTRVLKSGWVGMGSETIAFERELAVATGAKHVVTVDTCTSAIFLSLLVNGVKPGDEVICPSLTWCSTANAALYLRARPVFCDIDPETLSVSPKTVLPLVSKKTRAVIVVHFGGYAVDVAALRRALPARVAIVEDAAHAFGSLYPKGGKVGSSGNLVCYSFYSNKNLATAEGGAVALHDETLANRLRSLRQHALPIDAWKRFTHPKTVLLSNQLTELGYKANYTDLQASIGRVQLKRQPVMAATRLAIAREYEKGLGRLPNAPSLQKGITDRKHARHLFTVQFPFDRMRLSRDELLVALRARNIGATIHYPALHTMPLYRGSRRAPQLPCTDRVAKSILTLPISASMTPADAREVIRHLRDLAV
jgi:perosamine synthetase